MTDKIKIPLGLEVCLPSGFNYLASILINNQKMKWGLFLKTRNAKRLKISKESTAVLESGLGMLYLIEEDTHYVIKRLGGNVPNYTFTLVKNTK